MPKPAFLVEGNMEKRIIEFICPGRIVNLINCNGDDVAIAAIAKVLNARIRMLRHCDPIIIILDRERRQKQCADLVKSLHKALEKYNLGKNLIIGMPDRTIEN